MQLPELLKRIAKHPQIGALAKILSNRETALTHVQGLQGSAAPVAFAALSERNVPIARPFLFILNDEEEAGYFYHDLTQLLDDERVLFYPSTYRRAVKYAQRDAANEILRTEVLNKLSALKSTEGKKDGAKSGPLYIVSFPAALSERVAPPQNMVARTINLHQGGTYDLMALTKRLLEVGFVRKDYVYEPGEFAVRGSILDIYSFASEFPYRVDFFGDDVESIRTFEVQTQLSKDYKEDISIVPDTEQGEAQGALVSATDYLPHDTLLVVKDLGFVHDAIDRIYEEGFARS